MEVEKVLHMQQLTAGKLQLNVVVNVQCTQSTGMACYTVYYCLLRAAR